MTFSSNKDFEKPALKAVEKYKYNPAQLDGQNVDSAESVRMFFKIKEHDNKVSREFYRSQKRAKRNILEKSDTQSKIRRTLDRLYSSDYLTMYSLSHLYLLELLFALEFLDKEQQITAAENILAFSEKVDGKEPFLTEDQIKSYRMNLLQLYIQTGRFGDARSEYFWLSKEIPDAAKPFKKAMKQVYEILRSNQSFSRKIDLTHRGYQLLSLTKRTFTVYDIEGEINALKLRCDRAYGELPFTPNSDFTVPESWGRCDVQVIGAPNTTANFAQL